MNIATDLISLGTGNVVLKRRSRKLNQNNIDIGKRALELRPMGYSNEKIAEIINDEGLRTVQDCKVHPRKIAEFINIYQESLN